MICLAGGPSAGRGLDVLSRQCSSEVACGSCPDPVVVQVAAKQRHQAAMRSSNTLA